MSGWNAYDDEKAMAEGWCLSECHGSRNGPWQIQALDTRREFAGDEEAWRHVVARAREGSGLHIRALEFVDWHNAREARAIREAVGWYCLEKHRRRA
jgi:hypothetical protein